MLPGSAASRSATSACTITVTTRIDGNSTSRCNNAGTATLYGRLATTAVGAAARSSRRRARTSRLTTVSR
ncbi:Uncharacterised protein [Mycobacterium tuberculosis]|nr:Uncharacterised protein [Mycobacterium tuberculosis]